MAAGAPTREVTNTLERLYSAGYPRPSEVFESIGEASVFHDTMQEFAEWLLLHDTPSIHLACRAIGDDKNFRRAFWLLGFDDEP